MPRYVHGFRSERFRPIFTNRSAESGVFDQLLRMRGVMKDEPEPRNPHNRYGPVLSMKAARERKSACGRPCNDDDKNMETNVARL